MGETSIPNLPSKGTDGDTYNKYRQNLAGACADIVVTTILENGKPAVIATKRAANKCFGGKWWMQGGAFFANCIIQQWVAERAKVECGCEPEVQGLAGVFYTCASDFMASTLQPCFVGFIPIKEVRKTVAADDDHSAVKLLTLEEVENLPEDERHWYPDLVFRLALESMP